MVQPVYAEPCVPPGHEVVAIDSEPPGAVTVTFTVDVVDPEALVAVSLYVVVAAGLMLVEPLAAVEVNVPGVMARPVAPVVAQLSVLLVPEFTLVGFAVKEVIAGMEPFPEDEFDEVVEPQLASPAQVHRMMRNSALRSNPDGLSRRVPNQFLPDE